MAEKRSIAMFDHWKTSVEKVDYFILGICAALTGYMGQHFEPHALIWGPPIFELASLLLFAAATTAALMRLRCGVAYWGGQVLYLEAAEKAAQYKTLLVSGDGERIVDTWTGNVMSRQQTMDEAANQSNRAEQAKIERAKWKGRFEKWYNVRDVLLIVGLACYMVAKVWASAKIAR